MGTSGMKLEELTVENKEIPIEQMGHVALGTAP